ncbi:MAG TPA: fasciclin domain-containing protein, partial [Miltoncostaeaceae bacterium]|nr:fasciclin domain-containing protein [Miltoncostaeaceae bacterium]
LDAVVGSAYRNPIDPATGQKSPTDDNWYDLDILREAVVALGLADAVAGLDGATVFAPNDMAFRHLVADLTNTPASELDESEVLAALVAIASDPAPLNGTPFTGAAALTQTVLYHVSPEAVRNLRPRVKGGPIPTLTTLPDALPGVAVGTLNPYTFRNRVYLGDGDANDRDPQYARFTVKASNGTVHHIDGVLRPLDLVALFPGD